MYPGLYGDIVADGQTCLSLPQLADDIYLLCSN